jgi:hypothetical protein
MSVWLIQMTGELLRAIVERMRPAIKPRQDRLDTFALVLAAVAIMVVLGAAAWAINLQNAPKPNPPTPAPVPTLAAADLTATQSAGATASANQQLLALTLAAVMQVTPGSVARGIHAVGVVQAPGSMPDFEVQNVWVGSIDGNWISLYAGALHSDPRQGALMLVAVLPDRLDQQRFVVPLSQGALRITAENVQRLTLTSPTGTTYFFDVLARRFVGSLIEYAETATPRRDRPTIPPTMTPTATAGTPGP